MPELPEVETVRRTLLPLIGGVIDAVEVREARLRRPVAGDVAERLRDRRFTAVERRGKYLLLRLDDRQCVLAHLGMSGTLVLSPSAGERRRHDHLVVRLRDGRELVFNDPRRFGLWRVGEESEFSELRHLGPDPLSAMPAFEEVWRLCRGRKRPIKNLLLDQRVFGGIGNIYASEILYRAGVRPQRPSGRLRRAEVARLIDATREVLQQAVALGGSSISDYRDGDGRPGYFQIEHRVYDRAGQPCRKCGAIVRRLVQQGRSSFYCPNCQG